MTRIASKRSYKFGFQFDPISGVITQSANSRGNLTWNGRYFDIPNQSTNQVGVSDFLLVPSLNGAGNTACNYLGGPSSYTGSNYAGTGDYARYRAAYAQDIWKVTPPAYAESRRALGVFQPLLRVEREAGELPNG